MWSSVCDVFDKPSSCVRRNRVLEYRPIEKELSDDGYVLVLMGLSMLVMWILTRV